MIRWLRLNVPYLLFGRTIMDMPDSCPFNCTVCGEHVKIVVVSRKTQRAHLHPCGHELTFAAVVRASKVIHSQGSSS